MSNLLPAFKVAEPDLCGNIDTVAQFVVSFNRHDFKVSWDKLEAEASDSFPDKNFPVVYCSSFTCTASIQAMGYTKVLDFKGGKKAAAGDVSLIKGMIYVAAKADNGHGNQDHLQKGRNSYL